MDLNHKPCFLWLFELFLGVLLHDFILTYTLEFITFLYSGALCKHDQGFLFAYIFFRLIFFNFLFYLVRHCIKHLYGLINQLIIIIIFLVKAETNMNWNWTSKDFGKSSVLPVPKRFVLTHQFFLLCFGSPLVHTILHFCTLGKTFSIYIISMVFNGSFPCRRKKRP